MLIENDANITYKDVTVAGHKASCIDYNVARSPVSVHLPLNRIIAGLLVETHKVGEPLDFLVHCSDSVTLVCRISCFELILGFASTRHFL